MPQDRGTIALGPGETIVITGAAPLAYHGDQRRATRVRVTAPGSYTTPPSPSTTPTITAGPTISNLAGTSVSIGWTLSEKATGQVEYGTTTAYGNTSTAESSFDYSTHFQGITGLTQGVTYHYRVKGANAAGNQYVSTDRTFVTSVNAFPPNTTLTNPSTPSLALPAYLTAITDPTWGTKVKRISNVAGRRHAYSKRSPWNADGTRFVQPFNTPYAILDGTTFAVIRTFGSLIGDSVWSPVDPRYMFGTWNNDNNLYRQDMTNDNLTVVHTFTGYDQVALGNYEGNLSDDGRYCMLTGRNGSSYTMLVYDFQTNSIRSSRSTGSYEPSGPSISPSGLYVLQDWLGDTGPGGEHGFEIYNTSDMSFARRFTGGSSHADAGYDIAGNEVVAFCFSQAQTFRLSDGTVTNNLPSGSVYGEGHVSMRATNRPGWAYYSQYTNSSGNGRGQVVAVKLDGSGTVEVFAHTHHSVDDYEKQPQAVPSKDGTRVVFASEWEGSNVYDFVAGVNV